MRKGECYMKNSANNSSSWLMFAREDLRVAELVLDKEVNNQVCFHSQQCAEKALKAWLVHQGKVPPRVHQLATLMSLITEDFLSDLRDGIELLDQLYIPTRYPDTFPGSLPEGMPNEHQTKLALSTAQKILRRIEQNIGE